MGEASHSRWARRGAWAGTALLALALAACGGNQSGGHPGSQVSAPAPASSSAGPAPANTQANLALAPALPAECKTPQAQRLLALSIHTPSDERESNMPLYVRCAKVLLQQHEAQVAAAAATTGTRSRALAAGQPREQTINFESPHVHPLELTPDGNTLLAVNTMAHSLEVFRMSGSAVVHIRSIPVGLDPVSVRARSNTQAWVVNFVADSVSVVDLDRGTVVQTLATDNEPTDVVFAGTPQRAFVTASKANKLNVFDAANPTGVARQSVALQGLNPRALAVSNDGQTVFAAIFESGNGTRAVTSNNSATATIVRDNVLADNDVAIVNAATLAVSYQKKLMTMVMGIAVNPADNQVSVVGTELTNNVVSEPALKSIFVRSRLAKFTPGSAAALRDLNPHLDYSVRTVAPAVRALSLADPRGIAWRYNGAQAFVTGMGSNNVAVFDSAGARIGQFDVGAGPTGVALKDSSGLGYVLNRFDGTISVIDLNGRVVVNTFPFGDPTPAAVKNGRRFLYDARLTSGLGQASCASCHVDARTDRLAWDLSDPNAAAVQVPVASNSLPGSLTGQKVSLTGNKGPMATQTLIDIMGFPRFHWRGDRASVDDFNGAFVGLLGGDRQLSAEEMTAFKTYLSTLWMQPNPYRRIDDTRPNSVVLPDGRTVTSPSLTALRGNNAFANNCLACHSGQGNATRNFGVNAEIGSNIIAPALPGLYNKMGAEQGLSGFAFFHNATATLERAARISTVEANDDFLAEILTLEGPSGGLVGAEQRQVPHAGIGRGLTVNGTPTAAQSSLLTQIQNIAQASPYAALVARVNVQGISRGFVYQGNGNYRIDAAAAPNWTQAQLLQQAAAGNPVSFMLVVKGTETRIALDRNLNGVLDFDELALQTVQVSLDAPAANSSFNLGAPISLSASASDAASSVVRVDFYDGATLLGSDTNAPYTFTWNGAAIGSHTLTARAVSATGSTGTSAAVSITVRQAANAAPTVSLTAPSASQVFAPGSTITLAASAADSDGSVQRVEFFAGSTKIGESTAAPYSLSVANVPAGVYAVTARATDNAGASTDSAPLVVTVRSGANAPPTVALTSPVANQGFTAPATVTLTAAAADSDGTVVQVEFFNGSTRIGQATAAPYSLTFNNVPAGTYTVTARATDNAGATTTSAALVVTIR